MLRTPPNTLFEDIEHFRKAVPAVGEGDLDAPQEVEHHCTVARTPPAVHVRSTHRKVAQPAAPLEVGSEPPYEGGLAAPHPPGDQTVVGDAFGETLAKSFGKEAELGPPVDESWRQEGRVEGLFFQQNPGGRGHRGLPGTRLGNITFAVVRGGPTRGEASGKGYAPTSGEPPGPRSRSGAGRRRRSNPSDGRVSDMPSRRGGGSRAARGALGEGPEPPTDEGPSSGRCRGVPHGPGRSSPVVAVARGGAVPWDLTRSPDRRG